MEAGSIAAADSSCFELISLANRRARTVGNINKYEPTPTNATATSIIFNEKRGRESFIATCSQADSRPVLPQQPLLDFIRVVQVVQGNVAEHDEHAVLRVFFVLGRDGPLCGRERAKPLDHCGPLAVEAVHLGIKIEL